MTGELLCEPIYQQFILVNKSQYQQGFEYFFHRHSKMICSHPEEFSGSSKEKETYVRRKKTYLFFNLQEIVGS
jgi:hypothetical protein